MRPDGWGRIVSALIGHGHHWPTIKEYTRRQMALFYEEALQAGREARADLISDINIGMWGGDKIGQRLRQLRGKP